MRVHRCGGSLVGIFVSERVELSWFYSCASCIMVKYDLHVLRLMGSLSRAIPVAVVTLQLKCVCECPRKAQNEEPHIHTHIKVLP